jgi:uncharacterized protein
VKAASPTILLIPGWENSGPDHWQTHFERGIPNCVRVEQRDWYTPRCTDWVETIEDFVRRYERNVILVSHSCGSVAVAHWAARNFGAVKAAMIVGPTDVEQSNIPPALQNFAPLPLQPFGSPVVVVASRTDPWVSFERAAYFARNWGAEIIDAGPIGHINTASGHGPWPEGERILSSLVHSAHPNAVAPLMSGVPK